MDTQIITQDNILLPAVTGKQAIEAWKQYQELKKAILEKSDIQTIQGKEFLKKSYWRKVATFFNLTTEVVQESHEEVGNTIMWHFVVKAVASNGRYAIGAGSCDMYEKGHKNTLHNIRAMAETRATNRAISNLVGGGEVTAEEMEDVTPETIGEIKKQLIEILKEIAKTENISKALEHFKVKDIESLSLEQIKAIIIAKKKALPEKEATS